VSEQQDYHAMWERAKQPFTWEPRSLPDDYMQDGVVGSTPICTRCDRPVTESGLLVRNVSGTTTWAIHERCATELVSSAGGRDVEPA
jgi:hypothetical protein